MRKHILTFVLLGGIVVPGHGQTLSLDSCRSLALHNNKSLSVARLRQDMATYTAKAAKTKYLPKIDVLGGYEYTSREISLLNSTQKSALGNIGTSIGSQMGGDISSVLGNLVQQGVFTPDQATQIGSVLNKAGTSFGAALNQAGQKIVDAFRTDTRNIFAGSVTLRQPIYMGGSIIAANKIAHIGEEIASNSTDATTQSILYNIDQTYWTVVSLRHKQKLANQFLELVRKFSDDVHKMIDEGVATKADGLRVDVKVNEAEMTVTQAENGLSLARMLLCQQCGLPLDANITLADEDASTLASQYTEQSADMGIALENRPELKLLQNLVDVSRQSTKIIRAAYLPQVALTGGYLFSNPNVYNGYQNRFSGVWNVGVVVRIPLWNWCEGVYKVKSSKIATSIANLELTDAQEKMQLQVQQNAFKIKEAKRRLAMSQKNVENANENLRCANLGFKEGVLQTTEVMEAQTAWLTAQTQKIDAEIDLNMSQAGLRKAMGILRE